MTPEEKDQLLDRYVAGHPMSADEEAQVQQYINTDPDFRSEYQLRQTLLEAGVRERRAAWEARVKTHPLPVERVVFPMRWAAAASVVLLLGVGLIGWLRYRPLRGEVALFEQRDGQLGLAATDSSAVGTITWTVTKAGENQYNFSQLDTLQIFATDPSQWQHQTWRLMRLSEVRYRLRVGSRTYQLEQGRQMRLPLEADR